MVINYTYDANGTKLNYRTINNTESYDYIGSFYYENGTLSHILTSEGRVICDDHGNFDYYEYNLKDHLGNTRVVFTEDDGVIKNNDYYPFGMLMGGTDAQPVDGDNKFLYNGKEYINNTDLNLSWYDYGARFYDPQLGRWHVTDPLGEEYFSLSPYNYCANNPINFIDPNGLWIVKLNANTDDDGNTTYSLQFIAEENDNLKTFSTQSGISMETLSEQYGDTEFKVGDSYSFDKLEGVGRINTALQDPKLGLENCGNFALDCNGVSDQFYDHTLEEGRGRNPSEYPEGVKLGTLNEQEWLLSNNFSNVNIKNSKTGDIITFGANPENEELKGVDWIQEDIKTNTYPKHYAIMLLKSKNGSSLQSIIEKPGREPIRITNNFSQIYNSKSGFITKPNKNDKHVFYRKK